MREVLREGEGIGLVVGQLGAVSVTGYQGTEARKGIGGGARGARDVFEVNVERLHIGKPSNHSRREVGCDHPVAKRDVVCVCVQRHGPLPLSSVSTF